MRPCQVVWAPPQFPVVEVLEAPKCQICENREAVGLASVKGANANMLQRFDGCSVCVGITAAELQVGYKSERVFFVHSERELNDLMEREGLVVQHGAVCNCP